MRTTSTAKFRKKLCEAVLIRIREDVTEILAILPNDTPSEVGDCIRREALDQFTAVMMNRLTPEELVLGEVIERLVADSQRTAIYLCQLYLSRRSE